LRLWRGFQKNTYAVFNKAVSFQSWFMRWRLDRNQFSPPCISLRDFANLGRPLAAAAAYDLGG